VFANGGYLVKPNLITKIVDQNGKVIAETKFDHAGDVAPRVIDARNAFIMNSMMQSVIRNGTAAKAMQLGRSDLAGKTGTTNDHFDAWFAGYSPKQVAVAWIGFDKPQTLGKSETGAAAALPIWMKYMAIALKGLPDESMPMPEGISVINIDPTTGIRDESGMTEYFYQEYPPPQVEVPLPSLEDGESSNDPLSNQAQRALQPEVIVSPITPNQSTKGAKTEPSNAGQGAAARILNPN
jgi:penicillin-binding protein 1A